MSRESARSIRAVSSYSTRRPWLIIAAWVAVMAVLNLTVPQLELTVARHAAAFMPANTKAAQAFRDMSERFGVLQSSAVGSVVFVDQGGIDEQDQRIYRQFGDMLCADARNVAYVLDTYGNESARDIGLSPDGKAINLVVAGTGQIGTTKAHENTVELGA